MCALAPGMAVYQEYQAALQYVHGQRGQEPSVVNASVVSAVQGRYGNYHATEKTRGSRLWISPLMPLYWCFDLPAVAARSLLVPELRHTQTTRDALAVLAGVRATIPLRPRVRVRLA